MTDTTKQLTTAWIALHRAIQLSQGKSLERTIRPLMFAHNIVAELREYALLGEKYNAS